VHNTLAYPTERDMLRPIAGTFALLTLLTSPVAAEKKTITPTEARAHIGEMVSVCGKVVLVRKAQVPRIGATWQIYIDQTDPPVLALLASASIIDNPYFSTSDKRFSGKDVCAEGKVLDSGGLTYIRIIEPRQIRVVKNKD
jgi:hypothetical protein